MSDDTDIPDQGDVSSPCVRNCCLDSHDICIGCFRHLDEIIGWQQCSKPKKLIIQQRCDKRRKLANKRT
ncbi:MAG: DUF1289 domain-containing protein [Colwellia sp.]|nr:DUF1289 domain-containing protein [Colwellia sp.]